MPKFRTNQSIDFCFPPKSHSTFLFFSDERARIFQYSCSFSNADFTFRCAIRQHEKALCSQMKGGGEISNSIGNNKLFWFEERRNKLKIECPDFSMSQNVKSLDRWLFAIAFCVPAFSDWMNIETFILQFDEFNCSHCNYT